MPTRSAPSVRSILISAGVSKCGPGNWAYTPSVNSGLISSARPRRRGEYRSVRSTKFAPSIGEVAVRLRWSEISTGSPGVMPSRSPPAALVSTTSRAPAATAVRTPCATAPTPRPSYRWVRPSSTSARLSPIGIDLIRPECPATTGGENPGSAATSMSAVAVPSRSAAGTPPRTHDQRNVVVQDPGRTGQCAGGLLGLGSGLGLGIVRHSPERSAKPGLFAVVNRILRRTSALEGRIAVG